MERKAAKRIFFWGLYDFANTIYSMNVVSLYFPLLIVSNMKAPDIWVSVAMSASMIAVALTMPFWGALSDKSGRRTPYLLTFTLLACTFTVAIGFAYILPIANRTVKLFLISGAFIIANYGFQGGLVFYNSLLTNVAKSELMGRASGIGVAMGYIGSIVGMMLVMPFNSGEIFGIKVPLITGWGRWATFFPTAFFFFLFALPTIIFFWNTVGEKSSSQSIKEVFNDLRRLLSRGGNPNFVRFLIANFLFSDAVQTAIIFMGIYAERVMGLPDRQKIVFFVIATVGAVLGSSLWGFAGDRLGHKKTLTIVLIGWIVSLLILAMFPIRLIFWILGVPIGALLGGIWTTARPLLLELAPTDKVGQFFGLYAFSGRLAAVVGPMLWGIIVFLISPISIDLAYRTAVTFLALLVYAGFIVLRRVSIPTRA